ncbi:hypothetical protein HHE014_00650 [Helicobacter heilmannii]|nr:hypothetical protein HHE014_00650 [Helicobacter heilmannii]
MPKALCACMVGLAGGGAICTPPKTRHRPYTGGRTRRAKNGILAP